MFLKEKFEDGKFIKMKARLVADGRMQDRTVYMDFSSPTAKTRSVRTCLKLAATSAGRFFVLIWMKARRSSCFSMK
jgi:hypothetical protein